MSKLLHLKNTMVIKMSDKSIDESIVERLIRRRTLQLTVDELHENRGRYHSLEVNVMFDLLTQQISEIDASLRRDLVQHVADLKKAWG